MNQVPYYKLEDVCDIQIGKTPRREVDRYWGKGFTWVSISDMRSSEITTTKEEITNVAVKECGCKLIPKGTILLSFKLSIGKVAFAGKDLFTNEAIVGLPIKRPDLLHPGYLFYALKNIPLVGSNNAAMGSTLNKESMRVLKLPIPEEIDDQIRIADILSNAESLISQRKESLRMLDDLLKSTFLEMFGDPGMNNKSWREAAMVSVCEDPHDIKCGPFGTQLNKGEFTSKGVALWGIPQINSAFQVPPKDFLTKEKALQLEQYALIPGDIAMSRKGNVGMCCIYPEAMTKGIMHSDVLRIRADRTKMHPVFLLHQLRFSKKVEDQISSVSKGAVMAGINVGKLKNITIQMPPLKLQEKFAHIVEKTTDLKTHFQASLKELENLYGALSQKAFSRT